VNIKQIVLLSFLMVTLTTGAVMADDTFKVYGKLHMSIEGHDDGENSWMALSSNGSRFGIKGVREMNDSFTLIWQFEQKINIAQKGEETLATRNSFLGLKGNWGTALYGIHDTPYKTMGSKITFFRDEMGDYRMMTLKYDRRLSDVIMYVTPDFSGFTARLMVQVDQNAGQDDEAKTIFSGSLNYKKDNFYVGAAYETLSKGFAMADGPDGSLYGNSSKGLRLGAKYEFSKVGLTALYQNLADYNQSSFAVDEETGDVTTANDLQATTYGGEIRFKFAAKFAAKAGYYFTDPDTDTDDDEYQMFAIGVDHKYAKDLWFYLQYATVLNGDTTNASLGSKDNGHGKIVVPAAPGKNPSGISLGIAKKF